MSLEYTGIPYFPLTVNFFEEDVPELLEAKFGLRASYILIRLLTKIYREGYYITWGKEQCSIFLRKTGGEMDEESMEQIIDLLLEKGFFDKESYKQYGILTSESIQMVWLQATVRRKRDFSKMPYLLQSVIESNDKKKTTKKKEDKENADNLPAQNELNQENACNSGQSKQKQNKQKENKAPSLEKEEVGGGKSETSFVIPEYAYNTATHNVRGLLECLGHYKVSNPKEVQNILRLSDYGRKGTPIWIVLSNTNWNKIEAPGRYILASLTTKGRKAD